LARSSDACIPAIPAPTTITEPLFLAILPPSGRFGGNGHEPLGFGRGYPLELQPLRFDARHLEEPAGQVYFLFGLNITFQVMAITEMSAAHKDAVASLPDRL
jgi:hypothetical protein